MKRKKMRNSVFMKKICAEKVLQDRIEKKRKELENTPHFLSQERQDLEMEIKDCERQKRMVMKGDRQRDF